MLSSLSHFEIAALASHSQHCDGFLSFVVSLASKHAQLGLRKHTYLRREAPGWSRLAGALGFLAAAWPALEDGARRLSLTASKPAERMELGKVSAQANVSGSGAAIGVVDRACLYVCGAGCHSCACRGVPTRAQGLGQGEGWTTSGGCTSAHPHGLHALLPLHVLRVRQPQVQASKACRPTCSVSCSS